MESRDVRRRTSSWSSQWKSEWYVWIFNSSCCWRSEPNWLYKAFSEKTLLGTLIPSFGDSNDIWWTNNCSEAAISWRKEEHTSRRFRSKIMRPQLQLPKKGQFFSRTHELNSSLEIGGRYFDTVRDRCATSICLIYKISFLSGIYKQYHSQDIPALIDTVIRFFLILIPHGRLVGSAVIMLEYWRIDSLQRVS